MIKTVWNRSTRTYTVSSASKIVRNIPVRTQAECVAIELRNGFDVSFGDVTEKKGK